jgi:hypothetical protein
MFVQAVLAVLAGLAVPTRQAAEIDGCAFITATEVEAVMGAPLRGRPRIVRRTIMDMENYGCTYRSQDYTVEVRLETGRSTEGLEMYLKALGATVKGTTSKALQPVNGIGERAWWGPVSETNGMLHIVRGTDVLWVQTYGKTPGAGSLEKTRAIADKVFTQYQKVRK